MVIQIALTRILLSNTMGYEGGHRSIFVSAKPIILIGNVVLLMSFREKLRDNNLMYFISAYSRVYIYLFIHLFYVKI